nr:hypothetical protein [Vibrio toranzoniae]
MIAAGLAACTTQEVPTTHNYGVVTSGDFDFMKHDVVVGFGLAEESELNDESIFDAIKLSTGVPFYNDEGKLAEKGSLYIAFFVPNSEIVQWQALAQSGIQNDIEPSESKQRITGFIEMLFRRMPTR